MTRSHNEGNDRTASFQTLGPHDSVLVVFQSQGCTHRRQLVLEFRGSEKPSVSVTETTWNRTIQCDEIAELGSLALATGDLRRLDGLMRAYRGDPRGQCTTVERIAVVWRFENRPFVEEQFVDMSRSICDTRDVLRFDTLASRLKKGGPFERLPLSPHIAEEYNARQRERARAHAKRRREWTEHIIKIIQDSFQAMLAVRSLIADVMDETPSRENGDDDDVELRNRLAARLYRWIQEEVVLADSPEPWTFAADCRERLTCCSDASLQGLYRCLGITSQDLLRFKLALADWKLIAERFLQSP